MTLPASFPVLFWLAGAALLAVAAFGAPRLWKRVRLWRESRDRVAVEDVLKHVFSREQEGRTASIESVAGQLGISRNDASSLLVRMEAGGLLLTGERVRLTPQGARWAVQIVRAHRLWETWLADEAHLPLHQVHGRADRAEHQLSPTDVDRLDAQLGHPQRDPHGDPIPSAAGGMVPQSAQPLSDWPVGVPAKVIHVEDEPVALFQELSGKNIVPGAEIRLVSRAADRVCVNDGLQDHDLSPLSAGNIHVGPVGGGASPEGPQDGRVPLSVLLPGETGQIVGLDSGLRGFTRRRLLDLGLTPNAVVRSHLRNPFGEPTAYRVRGTTVALRSEQAAHIWVRRVRSERANVKAEEVRS